MRLYLCIFKSAGISIIFLASCVSNQPVDTPGVVSPSVTPSQVLTDTAEPTPISTFQPTLTGTTSPVVELTSDPVINLVTEKCLTPESTLAFIPSEEAIVLLEPSGRQLFLWDPSDNEISEISNRMDNGITLFDVSPNNRWLIFGEYRFGDSKDRVLQLFSKDTGITTSIGIDDYYSDFVWINDEALQMSPNAWDEQMLLPATILDPFQGIWQEISLDLSDIFFYPGEIVYGWGEYAYNHFVIDPTLSYAVYPVNVEAYDEFPIRLIRIENEEVIGELVTYDFFGRSPQWAPTGTEIAVITDIRRTFEEYQLFDHRQEIFTMSLKGEIKRETHLAEQYDSVFITQYEWSPDGTKIAIWISTDPESPLTDSTTNLLVLDIPTGALTDYCEFNMWPDFNSTVWSPDSHQILFGEVDQASGNITNYLLDIASDSLFKLEMKMLPVGWLTSE